MQEQSSRKPVAIVLRYFVRPAQTWILRHGAALQQFRPVFFARRIVNQDEREYEVVNLAHRSWLLKWILQSRKARLAHIHFLWNAVWFFKYWKSPSIPVIATAHGSDVNIAFEDRQYQTQIRRILEKTDKVICVSRFIKERLVTLGCPAEKLIVNPLGVPLRKVNKALANREPRHSGKIRLVCVAALREEKGHKYLLAAVKKVQEAFPGFQLDLIGGGPLKNEISQLIKTSHLENCVRLRGLQREEEVFRIMAESDICLQHSIRHINPGVLHREEGLPLSLVEAAALGLPLVATRVGGIPEICRHGSNGLLSEEKDIEAMAGNILELIRNVDMRREFGSRGRRLVQAEFDESSTMATLEEVYVDLINKKSELKEG